MKDTFKIGGDTAIDLPRLIESRLLVQANSGGGKSWAIRRILEQTHGKVQQIVIDPEGEFKTLREKHDYVLCGKDGDAPAEPRSAAMLARRLLELGASAIIDLYELHPQQRKHFVKLFLEALINAPKELWHDVLVVVDEAHVFAPEKGVSEALDAVIGLASLGRKRGYCAVLATQRISKLHKDASAECNNKLIGRATQDIDMKRAAEELGFTSRDQMLSLRALKPGEFYAFGPAISDEVLQVKVGDVKTTHPKAGSRGLSTKAPPPTAAVKKILGKLADLPKEAEKEINSIVEAHKKIRELEGELRLAKREQPPAVGKIVEKIKYVDKPVIKPSEVKALHKLFDKMVVEANRHGGAMGLLWGNFNELGMKLAKEIDRVNKPHIEISGTPSPIRVIPPPPPRPAPRLEYHRTPATLPGPDEQVGGPVSGSPKELLRVLVSYYPEALPRARAAAIAKIKPRSSTFRNAISQLKTRGYVNVEGDMLQATQAGIDNLGEVPRGPETPEEVRNRWLRELPDGPRALLEVLIGQHPSSISRAQLAELCSLDPNVSTFRNYLSHLRTRGLITTSGDQISAAATLF